METQIAYCSACDRDVRILVTEASPQDAQAPVPDAEVVCLEIGEQCTGTLCPVSAVSPAAMRVRLVRSGHVAVLQPIVGAECEMCGCVTRHTMVSLEHATCNECGTTIARPPKAER
jgi:hypothetical protein